MKAATSAKSEPRPPRFHFVGGKGGVGKTTCAAAFAVAEAAAGTRVLVASTDPAPSLSDAFRTPLSGAPRRIPLRTGTLHAVEIDAPAVLERWLEQRRAALEKIALEGTWLDREDVGRLLALSLPGIDEVAALLELARFGRSGRYDVIVVDTAPTGHTLRMLSMPETLFGLAGLFDRMRQKHRVMVEALRGTWNPDAEDALIHALATDARALADLLRDGALTRISWVTLPEPMAIEETADALAALARRGMRVNEIVVNRVTPPRGTRCGHCDARRVFESKAIRLLPRGQRLRRVQVRDIEPRGLAALTAISRELIAEIDRSPGPVPSTSAAWTATLAGAPVPADVLVQPATRLLLFGGKGGVGKTTCAAAAAIAAAMRWPDRDVLLISTDPAHSLGDALGIALSDVPTPIRGAPANLSARELDATRVLEIVREKYAAAIDQMFARVGSGGAFRHDRSVMQGLIDLAPPGLDELAAIIDITDALARYPDTANLVVVDTAPTGHALRLLEMPSLIHDWTRALMSILLKYQEVTGVGALGELLLKLSKGLGGLRDLLGDSVRTRFVVVTRPAALPRQESVRLVRRLERLGISVPAIVVNAVGRGRCAACRRAERAERREILAVQPLLRSKRQRRVMILAARQLPAPVRAPRLRSWQRQHWHQQ